MKMIWTGAHRAFAVETSVQTGDLLLQRREISVLISWSVGMMLFRIENRYRYGLKTLEAQVRQFFLNATWKK